jgi:hypothetical protein
MNEQKIKDIIDTYLKKWIDIKLNKLPRRIETEMADPNQDKKEEWRIWYPIDSKVTDSEIEEFETQIGHKLPKDYKTFLKYKHFYQLHISEVTFCRHPVNTWRDEQIKMIFEGYPTAYIIEKGYLPFADWSDWGVLCFDTNRNNDNSNYPIVLWDHEIAEEVQDKYRNFYDLLTKLDEDEKRNIS